MKAPQHRSGLERERGLVMRALRPVFDLSLYVYGEFQTEMGIVQIRQDNRQLYILDSTPLRV